MGTTDSWINADHLSLFYPDQPDGIIGPIPSVRLKAFRRGQQDVEYLVMLSAVMGKPRWVVGETVLNRLNLTGAFSQQRADDAGTVSYADLDPVDLWKLRMQVGMILDKAAPEPKRKWVDLRTPPRDIKNLPYVGYVENLPPEN